MKARPSITAVTFDVGGTLIEPWPSVGHLYAEVAAQWGIAGVSPDSLNQAFAAAWRARKPFDHSRAAWQRLVHQTFASAGAALPSDACFDAIYRRFAEASAWRVFDDVRPALEALAARGLRLGIISNWDERLRPLLAELGLAKHFRASIISCEVGCRKPDPEIFRRAATELDCQPAALVHVGDSAEEDAEGSLAAGMRAVLIDRGNQGARHGQTEPAGRVEGPPPHGAPPTTAPDTAGVVGAPDSDPARFDKISIHAGSESGAPRAVSGCAPPHVGGYPVISTLPALPASLESACTNWTLD